MPDFWERWKYLTSADVAVRNCVQTEICAFELQDGAGLNPDFKLNWRSSCFRGRYINKASLDFCHLTWDIKIYHFKDQPSVIKVISVIEHKWRARILALMGASPEVGAELLCQSEPPQKGCALYSAGSRNRRACVKGSFVRGGHPAGGDVQPKCQSTVAAVKGKVTSGSCMGQERKCTIQPRESRCSWLLNRSAMGQLIADNWSDMAFEEF